MSPSLNQSRPHTGLPNARRLVLSIMGPDNGGKTHFACTLPPPLVFLAMDPNTEVAVLRSFKVPTLQDLDPAVIRYVEVPCPEGGLGMPEKEVRSEAQLAWRLIDDTIRDLYEGKAPMPRSVVIDSGTVLDRLNKLREWGRTEKIHPNDRMIKLGNLNKELVGLFAMLAAIGVHVGVTHRGLPHWGDVEESNGSGGTETKRRIIPGVYDRMGYKEIGNLTNCEVLALMDATRAKPVSNRFGMKVLATRHRPAVIGDEYWGRDEETGASMASFAYLATQLFPGTDLEEWE